MAEEINLKTPKLYDNVLYSINVEPTNIILTRYLYIKDEVEIGLLAAILNKSNDALYWAYELYHSGFQVRFFELIWQIYYEFFAILNPSLEAYFLRKYSDWIVSKEDIYVSIFIENLLIRPYNTDVFLIKHIVRIFEIETIYCANSENCELETDAQIKMCIDIQDFRSLSHYILTYVQNDFASIYLFYEKVIDIININALTDSFDSIDTSATNSTIKFKPNSIPNKVKLLKDLSNLNRLVPVTKVILLSKILTLFTDANNKGRNFYVQIDKDNVSSYNTIRHIDGNAYTVLREEANYKIDTRFLELFKSSRNNLPDPLNTLRYHWLYFASFSPIWNERIQRFCGYVDYNKKEVKFIYESDYEKFYNLYNYEYDEMGRNIIENILPSNINNQYSWVDFYYEYRNVNLLVEVCDEELEEFGKISL
jgi:hypothetical protein